MATPEIVRKHREARKFARHYPQFDPKAEVLLLIGRDCGRAIKTKCLTNSEPYVHKSPLGYSLVGNVCLDSKLKSTNIRVMKTQVNVQESPQISYNFSKQRKSSDLLDIFDTFPDDDEAGLSADDRRFMAIIENIRVDESGSIEGGSSSRQRKGCVPSLC